MTEHVVTDGLRTIGCIRAYGRGFKAWSEPEGASLDVFMTYENATRAIYDHYAQERLKKAEEVDTE